MREYMPEQADSKNAEPPFWNTWIGAFLIVPAAFMFVMWAYYEFILFTGKSWAVYQQYSGVTTIEIDIAVIVLGVLAVYVYRKNSERIGVITQALLTIPISATWLAVLWAMLDMFIKADIAGIFKGVIEYSYGIPKAEPSIFDRLVLFNGMPIEAIMVSSLSLASAIALLGFLLLAGHTLAKQALSKS